MSERSIQPPTLDDTIMQAQAATIASLRSRLSAAEKERDELLVLILPFADDVQTRTTDRALSALKQRAEMLHGLKRDNQHNYERALAAESALRETLEALEKIDADPNQILREGGVTSDPVVLLERACRAVNRQRDLARAALAPTTNPAKE